MPEQAKPPVWSATVSAEWLPLLAGFWAPDAPPRLSRRLFIEPHPDGGVLLIATDGRAMGVVHDADGAATAARAVTLPPSLVEACHFPDMPTFRDQGDTIRPVPPPPTIVPDWVSFSDVGASVWTQEVPLANPDDETTGCPLVSVTPTPGNVWHGDDYRVIDETLPWRKALRGPWSTPPANVWLDLGLLAPFAAILTARLEAGGEEEGYTAARLLFGDGGARLPGKSKRLVSPVNALLVSVAGLPEFVGVVMLCHPPAVADWAALPAWVAAAGGDVA